MCVGCHLKALKGRPLIPLARKNENYRDFHEILMNRAINIVRLLRRIPRLQISPRPRYYLFTCDRRLHAFVPKLSKKLKSTEPHMILLLTCHYAMYVLPSRVQTSGENIVTASRITRVLSNGIV